MNRQISHTGLGLFAASSLLIVLTPTVLHADLVENGSFITGIEGKRHDPKNGFHWIGSNSPLAHVPNCPLTAGYASIVIISYSLYRKTGDRP